MIPGGQPDSLEADRLLSRSGYWDDVLEGWETSEIHRLWRAHSDAVNGALLRRWLPLGSARALKTDLFDEAVDRGPYPELAARCASVCGIDVSPAVARAAAARYPELEVSVGDVLDLPYPDGEFDVVFSNSTLDHFSSHGELRAGVTELARILGQGGTLLITLDNRANPVVAVRTSKTMASPLQRLGLVPYFVGATHGPRGLARLLSDTGFDVLELTTIMHCPPQLAAAARVRVTHGRVDERRHLRQALRFEALERLPTRSVTGHFVAARAVRR